MSIYDDYGHARSVDLEYAAKGYRLCPECLGQGTYMLYKCYGGDPIECEEYCDTCSGEGQVEIELVASISRNKSEGRFAGNRWNNKRPDFVRRPCRTALSPYNQWMALRIRGGDHE